MYGSSAPARKVAAASISKIWTCSGSTRRRAGRRLQQEGFVRRTQGRQPRVTARNARQAGRAARLGSVHGSECTPAHTQCAPPGARPGQPHLGADLEQNRRQHVLHTAGAAVHHFRDLARLASLQRRMRQHQQLFVGGARRGKGGVGKGFSRALWRAFVSSAKLGRAQPPTPPIAISPGETRDPGPARA